MGLSMDGKRFDAITMSFAGGRTRRSLLKTALSGALGGIAASIGVRGAGAASRARSVGNACRANVDCASNRCVEERRGRKICHCTSIGDCPGVVDQCHDKACLPSGLCGATVKTRASCNDGNLCTTGDVCQPDGRCQGTPIPCVASDQCHVAGACDPATGQCSNPPAAAGTPCDDGNACTTGDVCDGAGACAGTTAANTTACTTGGGGTGICCRGACLDYIVSADTPCCVSDGCGSGSSCVDCNANGAGTCQSDGSFCCESGFVCPAGSICLTVSGVTTCCANGTCVSDVKPDGYCLDPDRFCCAGGHFGSCPKGSECCNVDHCCIPPFRCGGGGTPGMCGCTATGSPVIDPSHPACCTEMSQNGVCVCAGRSQACVANHNCCSGLTCNLSGGSPGVCV